MTKNVGLYANHRWLTTVSFKYLWQGYLFHWLLNRSTSEHLGINDD